MKDHIWRRVLDVGHYLAQEKTTVREAAKKFGVSKSTVHKDVTERLPKVNPELAEKVRKVLEVNKAERHLRGGEATRRKYQGADAVQGRRSLLPEVE
ncbi:MAG: sporulation transcriptional regulator SpoIIID [Clostridiales bacterium]|nr:sporulation transcriptional regulator SpoIIID [Clostridiales bacterium]